MESILKTILDKTAINHKNEIINCKSIKDAHIYCKINNISGNICGILIEHYIKQKYNMRKNNVSLCIGDVVHNGTNIETLAFGTPKPLFTEIRPTITP